MCSSIQMSWRINESISLLFFRKRNFLDIEKIQFHRRRAPKDRHRNLQRRFLFVDIFNLASETLEWPRLDSHRLTRRVRELRLWLFRRRGLLISNLINFFRSQRCRMLSAHESRDLRRRANGVEYVVRNV